MSTTRAGVGTEGAGTARMSSLGAPTGASAMLAYSGALPLILGAVLAWARPDLAAAALRFMALYGGVLLVFFGGVRWGIAVMRERGAGFSHLLGAVVPAALGLPIILTDRTTLALGALAVILPLLLLSDLRETRVGSGAPAWYLGVRVPLTISMEAAVLAGLAAALL